METSNRQEPVCPIVHTNEKRIPEPRRTPLRGSGPPFLCSPDRKAQVGPSRGGEVLPTPRRLSETQDQDGPARRRRADGAICSLAHASESRTAEGSRTTRPVRGPGWKSRRGIRGGHWSPRQRAEGYYHPHISHPIFHRRPRWVLRCRFDGPAPPRASTLCRVLPVAAVAPQRGSLVLKPT